MQVELRPLDQGDEPLLWEYLYLAVFVPNGEPPLPREIIRQPPIARYVANWGRPEDRGLLAARPPGPASQGQAGCALRCAQDFAARAGVERLGGRDIGAAWLRIWPAGETGYGFVDHQTPELSIAVRPEYRGHGIGTLLLRHVLADADERYPAVSLSVSNANPAIRLYRRFGFEPVASAEGSTTMVRRRVAHYRRL